MTANLGDTRRLHQSRSRLGRQRPREPLRPLTEEVVACSRPLPAEVGLAAAEFALGQHLHRSGYGLGAVPHLEQAHRLDPHNWS